MEVKLDRLVGERMSQDKEIEERMQAVERKLLQLQHTTKSSESFPAQVARSLKSFVLQPREFEKTLIASRVYRRVEHRSEIMSFTSSVARASALSALSKFSLGNISVLSVVALPVCMSELSQSSVQFCLRRRSDDGLFCVNSSTTNSSDMAKRQPTVDVSQTPVSSSSKERTFQAPEPFPKLWLLDKDRTCAVCLREMLRAEVSCFFCPHTAHFSCADTLDDDTMFDEMPSGCLTGCECPCSDPKYAAQRLRGH